MTPASPLHPTIPAQAHPPNIFTCVVRRAHARIVVDPVHTRGVVFTVVVLTVIWVDLTPLSLKAQRAGATSGMCL